MNVIWITSDTFRRDHLGAYGNQRILTPSLDKLAAQAMRIERHYAAGFPTMPTRADHFTGRWTMSFMGWSPLPSKVTTPLTGTVGGPFSPQPTENRISEQAAIRQQFFNILSLK